ncbi:MAG: hypothetical protein ACRDBL_11245 [Rhabdaerophilum sp.]
MTKSALNSDLAANARAVAENQRAAQGEQLDFLAPVVHEPLVRFPKDGGMVADGAAIAANAIEERKRGRPKGAENLSSRQLREMLIRAGGHPLIHMARWASLTPEEMAMRLGCSVADALDRQIAIWDKLSPYIAAKLAPTDETGKTVPMINIEIGGQGQALSIGSGTGQLPPWIAAMTPEQRAIIEGVALDVSDEQNQGDSASRAKRVEMEGEA